MPAPPNTAEENSRDFADVSKMGGAAAPERSDLGIEGDTPCTEAKRSDDSASVRLFVRDDEGMDRVVFAEMLIPNVMDVYGDLYTAESIKEFAYGFMLNAVGIDIDHDNVDRSDLLTIVESFLVREGDIDFIPGSWVIGMHIADDEIWGKVMAGELNGFSYEAMMNVLQVDVEVPVDTWRIGVTQPDTLDGHIHEFFVLLDEEGRVVAGGTSDTNGHRHLISSHTFTESAEWHSHIFNFILGTEGL